MGSLSQVPLNPQGFTQHMDQPSKRSRSQDICVTSRDWSSSTRTLGIGRPGLSGHIAYHGRVFSTKCLNLNKTSQLACAVWCTHTHTHIYTLVIFCAWSYLKWWNTQSEKSESFPYTNLLCVEVFIIHYPLCSCSVGSLCPVKSPTRLRVKGW